MLHRYVAKWHPISADRNIYVADLHQDAASLHRHVAAALVYDAKEHLIEWGMMKKKQEARKRRRAEERKKQKRREEEKKKPPVICDNLCNLWTGLYIE